MPKTLEVDVTARIKAGMRLSLEPQFLPIALLDWTIKLEREVCSAGF